MGNQICYSLAINTKDTKTSQILCLHLMPQLTSETTYLRNRWKSSHQKMLQRVAAYPSDKAASSSRRHLSC